MLVSTKNHTRLCDGVLIPVEWYGKKLVQVKYIPKLDDGKILLINLVTLVLDPVNADWGHIDMSKLLDCVGKATQTLHNFLTQTHYTLPENFDINIMRYTCLWSMEIQGMSPCNFATGDDVYVCTYNSENNLYHLWELR